MLSSQFQGFCRDLHSEAADALASAINPSSLRAIFRARLTEAPISGTSEVSSFEVPVEELFEAPPDT